MRLPPVGGSDVKVLGFLCLALAVAILADVAMFWGPPDPAGDQASDGFRIVLPSHPPETTGERSAEPAERERPPALPESQFRALLDEAAVHYAEGRFRRSYNLYLAAEGFQPLPEEAGLFKERAWAMWSLKEVERDLAIRKDFDPRWAAATRSRLARVDVRAFPTVEDGRTFLAVLERLDRIAARGVKFDR